MRRIIQRVDAVLARNYTSVVMVGCGAVVVALVTLLASL